MLSGLMQNVPLTLNLVRERVEALHQSKTVATRYANGIHVATYKDMLSRSAQLANFLKSLGVKQGDRIATLAWNSQRHLELYLAVPCMGAVLHTVNVRLPATGAIELMEHAGDVVLFIDRSLVPEFENRQFPSSLRTIVVMEDVEGGAEALNGLPHHVTYEKAIADQSVEFDWPQLDENAASGICYTSGTTGRSKGVVYSHRSSTLHTLSCLFADGIAMRERDVCMPVVPMFHANAWGFPYAALMAGASLALPSRQTDPASLAELIAAAKVTVATAVPTVWLAFLEELRKGAIEIEDIKSMRRLPMGGAVVSEALIDGFAEFGVEVTHCWGMTEISPLGLVNVRKSTLSEIEAGKARSAQGLPIPGCKMRIVDESGNPVANDGSAAGELQVRSPWAAAAYYDPDGEGGSQLQESFVQVSQETWLRTGDIATIDPQGYVRLVDRAKDLIKSGGEWISSQALENELMRHGSVVEAAVVAKPDERWQERPVAFVVLREPVDGPELREHLLRAFSKWQVPDKFHFVAELPKGRTGKIDKMVLREKVSVL